MIRAIFILANLGIFLAYLSIAFRRAAHIKSILNQTKWWGVVFFVTCGLSHLFMADMTYYPNHHWHDTLPWWFVANTIIQFFAAWFFLQSTQPGTGFSGQLDSDLTELKSKKE